MVGRALECYVQRDLEAMRLGRPNQLVEISKGAELRMNRLVPAAIGMALLA
jgi:hypothetical protein